jgi:adenylate kinase family enzyme
VNPVLLIFGPSGVGKSTLADWIVEELDFLHFNFDNWDRKGIDGSKIRSEWKSLISRGQPQPLRLAIDRRLKDKKGALLTFPSNTILGVERIHAAEKFKIKTVFLDGSEENCLKAFIKREKEIGRNLPISHWHRYNDHIYDGSSIGKAYAPYMVKMFKGKHRKNRESLMGAIRKRLGKTGA